METNQSSINQNLTGSEDRLKQTGQNQKLFVAVVISILLIAILTGAAVYFWQKSKKEKMVNGLEQKIAPLEKQISTMGKDKALPQLTVSPVADWETYTNASAGYTISYPKGWTLEENVDPNEPGMIIISPPTATEDNMYEGSIIVLPNYLTTQSSNIKDVARLIQETARDVEEYSPGEYRKINQYDFWITKGGCCMEYGVHAFVIRGSSVFRITLVRPSTEDEVKIFYQILSTFKFLDY